MTLILPDDLPSFESKLSASQLSRITATLESERERLEVITAGTERAAATWALALRRGALPASLQRRDARRISGRRPEVSGHAPRAHSRSRRLQRDPRARGRYEDILYIGDVIHQANIDVDEKGTEAAAATAVIMEDTGGGCIGSRAVPRKTITLRLDHPFLFVLRDVETGAVLFMGRVVDPSVGR